MPKARRVHFDVETYRTRNESLIARLSFEAANARPSQNTAKAKKDEWDTKQAIDERIKTAIDKTAVNPLYAEILTVCLKTEDSEIITVDAMNQSEQSAIQQLSEALNDLTDKNTVWVAFNGKRFDLPLLLNRMARFQVKPPEYFPVYAGRWYGRIFDTMERMPTYDPFISFSEACEVYGLPCKTIELDSSVYMTGSMVGNAYESGRYQLINDYCADDVINEERLYLAMTHNDTFGTFDKIIDDDLIVLKEIIDDTEMSHSRKWIASQGILNALTKGL